MTTPSGATWTAVLLLAAWCGAFLPTTAEVVGVASDAVRIEAGAARRSLKVSFAGHESAQVEVSLDLDTQLFASAPDLIRVEGTTEIAPYETLSTYWKPKGAAGAPWGSVTLHPGTNEVNQGILYVDGHEYRIGDVHTGSIVSPDDVSTSLRRLRVSEDLEAEARLQAAAAGIPHDIVLEIPEEDGSSAERRRMQETGGEQSPGTDDGADPATDDGSPVPFFPNCYPGDLVTRVVQLSLVLDVGYQIAAGKGATDPAVQRANILYEIEAMLSVSRVVYLAQLNVGIQVRAIVFGTTASRSPLNAAPSLRNCGMDVSDSLSRMYNWYTSNDAEALLAKAAGVMMLTDCHPSPGSIGIAYREALCDTKWGIGLTSRNGPHLNPGASTWLSFAHELGHIFGAGHSFENGVGRTGGIMDYSNGRVNGVIQFQLMRRAELCAGMTRALNRQNCPYIALAAQDFSCGNGVLEAGEDCECLEVGSRSCGKCVACKTQGTVQCSAKDFVLRERDTPLTAVVSTEMLAHAECCTDENVMAPPMSTCGGRNVCLGYGKCDRVCSRYALPGCGWEAGGCIQKCSLNDACRTDIFTQGPPKLNVHFMPAGASCYLPSSTTIGECDGAGACTNIVTAQPTVPRPTTATPTSAGQTWKPTAQPTTTAPSNSPTVSAPTKSPTMSSPTPQPTTSSPTFLCPDVGWINRVAKATTLKQCNQQKAAWCGAKKKCQLFGILCTEDIQVRYAHCPPFLVTGGPTSSPTLGDGRTANPTKLPTVAPTFKPTTKTPTVKPTKAPTSKPTTKTPTVRPTKAPSNKPTVKPTLAPSQKATAKPTLTPTNPTKRPTKAPTTPGNAKGGVCTVPGNATCRPLAKAACQARAGCTWCGNLKKCRGL